MLSLSEFDDGAPRYTDEAADALMSAADISEAWTRKAAERADEARLPEASAFVGDVDALNRVARQVGSDFARAADVVVIDTWDYMEDPSLDQVDVRGELGMVGDATDAVIESKRTALRSIDGRREWVEDLNGMRSPMVEACDALLYIAKHKRRCRATEQATAYIARKTWAARPFAREVGDAPSDWALDKLEARAKSLVANNGRGMTPKEAYEWRRRLIICNRRGYAVISDGRRRVAAASDSVRMAALGVEGDDGIAQAVEECADLMGGR